MGKKKYGEEIERLFKKSITVNYKSIERIIKNKSNSKQYTKQLIKNMISKGKIKRLTKGYYTVHNNASIAVFCFKPSYLGLQDAMSFHDLWEQETIPVIITTRKIRQGIRKVLGVNVLIRRINKKYHFGFDYYKDKFYLPYSDIEKTFIDMVYFNQRLDKEVKQNFVKKINKQKLNDYLKNYPKNFKNKVLNLINKS